MDQHIGIKFEASGQGTVFSAFDQISTHIDRLDSKLRTFSQQMKGFGNVGKSGQGFGGISQIANSLEKAGVGANQFTRALERGAVAAQGLHASVNATAAAAKKLETIKIPPMAGAPVPVGGGQPFTREPWGARAMSQRGIRPLEFMGQYVGARLTAGAFGKGIKNVAFGASRTAIEPGLRDLIAEGYTREQRKGAEIQGMDTLEKYPQGGELPGYLKARADLAAAFNVNDPMFKGKGMEQHGAMMESAVVLGAIGRMKTEESAKLLSDVVKQQITVMPESEREKFKTGEKTVSGLWEAMAGKMGLVMQDTRTWGQDIRAQVRYGMGPALQAGWSPDAIFAYTGAMKEAGVDGQKIAIGLRSLVSAEPGKLGVLGMAGAPDTAEWQKYQAATGRERSAMRSKAAIDVRRQMAEDPIAYMEKANRQIEIAKARGLDLHEDIKLLTRFEFQKELMGKPGVVEKQRELTAKLRATKDLRLGKEQAMEQAEEPGLIPKRLGEAATGLAQSFARTPWMKDTIDSWVETARMIREFNDSGDKLNPQRAKEELRDFVKGGLGGEFAAADKWITDQVSAFSGFDLDKLLPAAYKGEKTWNFPDAVQGLVTQGEAFFDKLNAWGESRINDWKSAFAAANAKINPFADKAPTPLLDSLTGIPEMPTIVPKQAAPESPMLRNIMPSMEPASWNPEQGGGGDSKAQVVALLEGILATLQESAGQSGTAPRVFIGNREIQEVVMETLEDKAMHNRQRWGGSRFS